VIVDERGRRRKFDGSTPNGGGDGFAFSCGQPLRACPQESPRRLRTPPPGRIRQRSPERASTPRILDGIRDINSDESEIYS
jgi:hypothetical protein